MESALPMGLLEDLGARLLRRWGHSWLQSRHRFRQWERQELIKKTPSAEDLARHRRVVSAFIRMAYLLQALMEDPGYPAREFLPEVRGKLRQLEHTKDMIHNPMPDEEAERILKEVFPDDARAGATA